MGGQPALQPISAGVSSACLLLCNTASKDAMVSNKVGNRYNFDGMMGLRDDGTIDASVAGFCLAFVDALLLIT